jgi:hypothetical protein
MSEGDWPDSGRRRCEYREYNTERQYSSQECELLQLQYF